MKRTTTLMQLMALAALVGSTTAAWALKLHVEMTPRNLAGNGFKVKTDRDGEDVKFVVERDLKKSTWTGRSGYLSLPGEDGKSKNIVVKPVEKDGLNTYRFAVRSNQVTPAVFTVTEIQRDESSGIELIGGGTYYRFQLADFTRRR